MSQSLVAKPTINSEDHGAKVVLCGALMITPIVMMASMSFYNRMRAKSLLHLDGLVAFAGTILAIGSYATFVHAKNIGFGKHAHVHDDLRLNAIGKTILGTILLSFLSQGLVVLAFNLLARKTARSQRFIRNTDIFSGVLVIWTISNVVVIALSMSTKILPPYAFFLVSGSLKIIILLGQIASFLRIIFSTSAPLPVKVRWSLTLGSFVPVCLVAIVLRLIVTPKDFFAGDWTFTSVNTALLFIIEMFLSVMNLLAPNLPIFFDKTSTGGLHFRPGDTRKTAYSSSAGLSHYEDSSRGRFGSRVEGKGDKGNTRGDHIQLTEIGHNFSASIRGEQERRHSSFDSDAILVRRSVDVS